MKNSLELKDERFWEPPRLLPIPPGQSNQLYPDKFADHCEQFSHNQINRYLAGEKLTPRLVWEKVAGQVVATAWGYLVFDRSAPPK